MTYIGRSVLACNRPPLVTFTFKKKDHRLINQRQTYLITGLPDSSSNCLKKGKKRRKQDSHCFFLTIYPGSWAPPLWSPRLPCWGRAQFFRWKPAVSSPMTGRGIKPSFISLKLCLCVSIQHQLQEPRLCDIDDWNRKEASFTWFHLIKKPVSA